MSEAHRVHLFPVRHHSPRASVVLLQLLERVAPDVVLIEGPADATALIPILTDPETRLPVAILAYRTDGESHSCSWPFATYSPEYAALRWATDNGKVVRFIDVRSGQTLGLDKGEDALDVLEGPSPFHLMGEHAGFRSFDEFWEARFESPAHSDAGFREALRELAETVRHGLSRSQPTRARDAVMRAAIDGTLADGIAPDRVVAVLGAAHVAAIVAGDVDDASASLFEREVPVAITLIPYSFPRLAEQTGYGAGNRAPFFYQRAFDAGGDYQRATLEVLVDFTDHLRLRGFSVSLADTIEAYRLACRLSDIRGKNGPGIDEVREATVATLCRGEAKYVDDFLWSSVVGKGIGHVAKGVGKNSLQEEFWRTVGELKLPKSDEPESVSLRLADTVHVEISTFLHRLRVLDVPYASLAGTKTSKRSGGTESLSRVREAWQCQWTPSTEIALVERIVLGDTLVAGTERKLGARLAEGKRAGDATEVLFDAVIAAAPGVVALALAACDSLAANDDDIDSLASACRALSGLVAYGSNREALGVDESVLTPLLTKTFARATLRIGVASSSCGSDDDAEIVASAMRVLQETAVTQPCVDRAAWVAELTAVANSFGSHPHCAGIAAGLLLLARMWDDDATMRVLELRMSATSEPAKSARFLAGFIAVNALAIVKNRSVVEIMDTYIQALPREAFRDAAPMLRRAFADLGKTERRYLVENVLAVRSHLGTDAAATAARVVTSNDEAALRAASAEIAKAMDDLDDLL